MSSASTDGSSYITLLVAAGFAWLLLSAAEERFAGKLAAYPVFCEPGQPGPSECPIGRWKAYQPVVFAATPAQQMVVMQLRDTSPMRLTGCVVLDRLNWRCTDYEATDGDVTSPSNPETIRFLSRWRWYAFKYLGIRP